MTLTVETNISGCMMMFGGAIRLAIMDFKAAHKYHKSLEAECRRLGARKRGKHAQTRYARLIQILHQYQSAEHFLFSPQGLELFINMTGLDLNIDYVRKIALDDTDALNLRSDNQAMSEDVMEEREEFVSQPA